MQVLEENSPLFLALREQPGGEDMLREMEIVPSVSVQRCCDAAAMPGEDVVVPSTTYRAVLVISIIRRALQSCMKSATTSLGTVNARRRVLVAGGCLDEKGDDDDDHDEPSQNQLVPVSSLVMAACGMLFCLATRKWHHQGITTTAVLTTLPWIIQAGWDRWLALEEQRLFNWTITWQRAELSVEASVDVLRNARLVALGYSLRYPLPPLARIEETSAAKACAISLPALFSSTSHGVVQMAQSLQKCMKSTTTLESREQQVDNDDMVSVSQLRARVLLTKQRRIQLGRDHARVIANAGPLWVLKNAWTCSAVWSEAVIVVARIGKQVERDLLRITERRTENAPDPKHSHSLRWFDDCMTDLQTHVLTASARIRACLGRREAGTTQPHADDGDDDVDEIALVTRLFGMVEQDIKSAISLCEAARAALTAVRGNTSSMMIMRHHSESARLEETSGDGAAEAYSMAVTTATSSLFEDKTHLAQLSTRAIECFEDAESDDSSADDDHSSGKIATMSTELKSSMFGELQASLGALRQRPPPPQDSSCSSDDDDGEGDALLDEDDGSDDGNLIVRKRLEQQQVVTATRSKIGAGSSHGGGNAGNRRRKDGDEIHGVGNMRTVDGAAPWLRELSGVLGVRNSERPPPVVVARPLASEEGCASFPT